MFYEVMSKMSFLKSFKIIRSLDIGLKQCAAVQSTPDFFYTMKPYQYEAVLRHRSRISVRLIQTIMQTLISRCVCFTESHHYQEDDKSFPTWLIGVIILTSIGFIILVATIVQR